MNTVVIDFIHKNNNQSNDNPNEYLLDHKERPAQNLNKIKKSLTLKPDNEEEEKNICITPL